MQISITVAIVAVILIPLRISLFEAVFALILCTPVMAFMFGQYLGMNTASYFYAFLILYAALAAISFQSRKERKYALKEELLPILLFIIAFHYFHSLTLKWPDFIAIGERLRDYAILSSVIQSPLDLKEPWMAGYPLNYYAFWYRVGHMFSALYSLKTWEVYHLLQSFTYALYFACGFRFLNGYLKVRKIISLFFSLLLVFGSNLAGIKDYFFEIPGWWEPSRVIPGAINEFPAWSFLLGDLHPHFLNLPLIPFFLIFLCYSLSAAKSFQSKLLIAAAALIPCSLWIANSNVWEVPVWLLLCSIILTFFLIELIKKTYIIEKTENGKFVFKFNPAFVLTALIITTLSISLYISKQHIVTPDYPVCFVNNTLAYLFSPQRCLLERTIPLTSLYDLSLHFGIPLLIISVFTIYSCKETILRVLTALLTGYFFFFTDALPFLLILFAVNLYRVCSQYGIFSKTEANINRESLLTESLCLFSLALLLVPEIIFLDDPYGGENDRMNTIFKIYSAAWFFIHAYSFWILSLIAEKIIAFCGKRKTLWRARAAYAALILLIFLPAFILNTGFFFITAEEDRHIKEQNIQPYAQGLGEVERLFPGSAKIIQGLQKLPKGVLLEAQGKPYDYTTMIATLSENPSYVGWVNHLNLLLSNNPEIQRREKISEEFYNTRDCQVKKKILTNENISYVVLGPLEKARYAEITEQDFACLRAIKEAKEFKIFAP